MALLLSAALLAALGAGTVDQDAPHRRRRRRKEVTSVLKLLIAHQTQVGFVHQGRGAECVTWVLSGHLRGGKLAQLVVNEWQYLSRHPLISGRGRIQKASDLRHGMTV